MPRRPSCDQRRRFSNGRGHHVSRIQNQGICRGKNSNGPQWQAHTGASASESTTTTTTNANDGADGNDATTPNAADGNDATTSNAADANDAIWNANGAAANDGTTTNAADVNDATPTNAADAGDAGKRHEELVGKKIPGRSVISCGIICRTIVPRLTSWRGRRIRRLSR